MVLSSRQYLLLRTLLDKFTPVSSESLCREIECSARTLRYDVSAINDCLKCKLITSSKHGYMVDRTLDIHMLMSELNYDSYNQLANKLMGLIIDRGNANILDVCEQLFISESTASVIVKKQVNPVLERFGLRINVKNCNFVLVGEEHSIRQFIVKSAFDGIPVQNFFQSMGEDQVGFSPDLTRILEDLLKGYGIQLDDIYFKNFQLSVEVTLRRVATGHALGEGENPISKLSDSRQREFATELLETVRQKYGITVGSEDAQHILGFVKGYFKNSAALEVQAMILRDEAFRYKVETALEATARHFNVRLDYSGVIDSIVLHCYYMMLRVKEGTHLHNSLTADLKYNNPFVYELSVYMIFLLEQMLDVKIPYEEIGLVAVYLGTLMDTSQSGGEKVRVICVCPRYNNLRTSVETQLNNLLKSRVEIVKFVSTLGHINREDEYDFVISLEREHNIFSSKKIIYVSPIITPSGYLEIERWVLKTIKDRRDRRIRSLMERYLDEELFFLRDDDREQTGMDVLIQLNKHMMEKGIVGPDFLANVLAREKLATTAFFEKFAIPHALNINSNDTKIAYYYSQKPIKWFGTNVNLVVMLTAKEYDKSFSELYEFIFYIMTNNELYHQMVKCSTFNELQEFFRSHF